MNFKEQQKMFATWGYVLKKQPLVYNIYGYIAYRKDNMVGVLYSDTVKGLLQGIDKHMEKIK